MSFLIYGKRTGQLVYNEPVYDKTFRALNYQGIRVNKLSDAGEYATKEDAQKVIDDKCKEYLDKGWIQVEIRKAK